MKKTILFLSIFLAISCEDDSVPGQIDEPVSLVGLTFSGYSFKSTFSGASMYQGYEFFSADSCYDLLLQENSRVVSKTKRAYMLSYPEVRVYDSNAAAGYWLGSFSSSGSVLSIKSLKLQKW